MNRVEALYERFEAQFRGTREEILERLRSYTPILELVEKRNHERVAIDCGCGRGEWLELLTGRGWTAYGVDLSEAMLAEAAIHGLKTVRADAIDYLKTFPDGSVTTISAFHVVEHLPAEQLLGFLTECSRVLAKNGIVLLETPNPENVRVGTSSFYLDPTHDKPLPPQLLQFYVEQSGFGHARVLRINGTHSSAACDSLEAAVRPLFDSAMDYAVIGTKSDDVVFRRSISDRIEALTQPIPFALPGLREYDQAREAAGANQAEEVRTVARAQSDMAQGLHSAIEAVHNALNTLGGQVGDVRLRLEHAIAVEFREAVGSRVQEAVESLARPLDRRVGELAAEMSVQRAMLGRIADEMERHKDMAATEQAMRQESADAVRRAVDNVTAQFHRSTSWRITAPLRALSDLFGRRAARVALGNAPAVSIPVARRLLYQPFVWQTGRAIVKRLPAVRWHALTILQKRGLLAHPLAPPESGSTTSDRERMSTETNGGGKRNVGDGASALTPEALRLYKRFVAAQERRRVMD